MLVPSGRCIIAYHLSALSPAPQLRMLLQAEIQASALEARELRERVAELQAQVVQLQQTVHEQDGVVLRLDQ